ncbi:DinB family protein [Sungkyunkwania multivorans]|uniref:DinB family protein n=1 Tax=Sungkyunkwania multivorans TaxID=1173618 RepID=A0ABW3CSB5_9FLAO
MESSKQLANRFREVILDGTWIANTNFKHQLAGLTWEEATTKVGALNTIAALTFHINYYIAGVLNVFEGGALEIRDKYSFDHPQIESEEEWQRLLGAMWRNAAQFADHIENLPESKLEDFFVDKKYGTYRRNIEGMIEHSYYHLGQISFIKKILSTSAS